MLDLFLYASFLCNCQKKGYVVMVLFHTTLIKHKTLTKEVEENQSNMPYQMQCLKSFQMNF